jgi:type IV secretory pathway VirB3-like protein
MKEHHVYFSLITPPLISGIPSELFLWGATVLGMLFLYLGLLFDLKVFLFGIPLIGCLLYLLAIIMTKRDIFWFSVIVENVKLHKSLIFFKRKIKYRA